jgi:hypothetical protein
MKSINKFISRARALGLIFGFVEAVMLWLCVATGLLLIFTFIDYAAVLNASARRLFYYFSTGGLILILGYFVYSHIKYLRDREIVGLIQKGAPALKDELLSAVELGGKAPAGVSGELVEALKTSVEKKLAEMRPLSAVFNFKNTLSYLKVLLALLCLNSLVYFAAPAQLTLSMRRVLASFEKVQWSSWFTVEPGNGRYMWGSAVRIKVIMKQALNGLPRKPALWVKMENGKWKKTELERETSDEFVYDVSSLVSDIEYYTEWSDVESGVFKLTPIMLPGLGNFSVKYKYPAYTQLPENEVRDNPNIQGLPGTKITISASANKKIRGAELATSWGARQNAVVDGTNVTANFVLTEAGSYVIKLDAEDGIVDPQPPQYPVAITVDNPPVIDLLSPQDDLTAAKDVQMILVGQAQDDFGLKKIALNYRINNESSKEVSITEFKEPVFSKTFDYNWNLSRLDLKAGDKVVYYLEAVDNDIVKGPKTSKSARRSVEITDYDREHDKIEASLKDFREQLLSILADQTLAQKNREELEAAFSTGTFIGLKTLQAGVRVKTGQPQEALKQLITKMESDPYTDFSTLNEFKAIGSHLGYLKDNPMADVLDKAAAKNWEVTRKDQDEIAAGLQKIILLSEDLLKYQKMRDLLETGSQLKNSATNILDSLSQEKTPEKLQKELDKIKDLLGQIDKQLSKFPKDLPEDFINDPAVKKIDMQQAAGLLDKLSEAIKSGDWDQAKKLAEQLSAQLDSMMKSLGDAGESSGFSSSTASKLESELADYGGRLQKIASAQTDLTARIEKLDASSKDELFKQQEDLLKGLAAKQRGLLRDAEPVRNEFNRGFPFQSFLVVKTIELMQKVLNEFESKRVFYSQKYLQDVINQWEDKKKIVTESKKDLRQNERLTGEIGAIAKGEEEILESLKTPTTSSPAAGKEKDMADLSKSQSSVEKQTGELRKDLEKFLRKSALVNPETTEGLRDAGSEMRNAGTSLDAGDSGKALESSRRALEHLGASVKQMGESQDNMTGQAANSGKMAGQKIQRRSAGGIGVYTSPVKMPNADEYKAPKELRQDIIDAMQEKYPVEYEKIIKDYYRRLTQ